MSKGASTGAVAEAPRQVSQGAAGPIVRVVGLRKTFNSGGQDITPLNGVDFCAGRGEMVSVVGPSGTGKSTFLQLLAALDTPTSGEVYFAGNLLRSFSEAELAEYRNRQVGFVWQRHHLLPDFSAAENVAMPLLVHGETPRQSLQVAQGWLREVGLEGRAEQRAGELSGGEQQRVAIARALANQPSLLLADEPTGDLDERNAQGIFDLLERLHRSHHLTSIVATHNVALARRADRMLALEHGKLAPSGNAAEAGSAGRTPPAGAGARVPGGLE